MIDLRAPHGERRRQAATNPAHIPPPPHEQLGHRSGGHPFGAPAKPARDSAALRVIRVLGLRDLDAAEVSVSLSALFPTPVFAEPDKQPGYGFSVVPTVVFNDLFADYPSRWHEFNGIWGVTLKIKRQSNGEAFNAHLTPLTV